MLRKSRNTDSPKVKKHRKLKITLSIIAALLIVVLVAGWLTNWFGFYGPGTKILLAAKNTLYKSNFTVSFTFNGTERILCRVNIDWDNKDMSLLMIDTNGKFICAIHDDHLITRKISFGQSSGYTAYNIKGFLNILFRVSTSDSKGINWKFILNSFSPGLYEDLSQDIDFSKMDKSLVKLFRKTNSNFWLKKNAGYSHSKKDGADIYSFQPDTYKLASASLACLENSFKSEDKYNAAQDSLAQSKADLQAMDYAIDIAVKDKLISQVNIRLADHTDIGIHFEKFGLTTIDTPRLDGVMETAERKDFSAMALLNILYAFL